MNENDGKKMIAPAPFKFTVANYYQLADIGILTVDDKVELIEGQVVRRNPDKSPSHAACVTKLSYLLPDLINQKVIISTHNPVTFGTFSELEPDLAVLRYQADYYHDAHPTPKGVFMIIEVSHTTQQYDRETKVPLFAQYGIPEIWIVDLKAKTIEVYSKPMNGEYGNKKTFQRGDVLESGYFERLLVSRVIK